MNISPIFSASSAFGVALRISRISVRNASTKLKPREKKVLGSGGQPEGHGEQIWLFNEIESNYTVYSFNSAMKATKALRQIPFNGKKLKPSKLRKDYWRPMAIIQFPDGHGHVGRSVYQKLREFRKRHELEWGERAKELLAMSKRDRGVALNDQKGTAVADVAAVLSGATAGNKIWEQEEGSKESTLLPVRIFWANELDKHFAREWSDNVTHLLGLPKDYVEPTPEEEVNEDKEGSASEEK